MPFVQSPEMDRRIASRHEEYRARSRDRDYPSDYDDYRRSRGSYEEKRSRQHEPSGYDSRATRDGYNRMDYGDRRSRPADPPSLKYSGEGRPRGGPSGVTPKPSRVLGVFGLSLRTEERHLYDIMSAYGPVEDIQIVYDSLTGRSRGFAFVYFQNMEDARSARAACADGLELHERVLRVDYSMTTGPHQPTPGVYMGKDKRRNVPNRMRRYGYSDRRSYRRSRSRTPTPRRRNGSSDYGGGYRRRSRVVSSSRSRSPPPIYSDQANGQRSPRSRSITQRDQPVRYSGPPKADDQWSDRSGSFH
ncbi:Transformer-2 protein like protein alpha [Fasciolopsis buskii]|uniref:Transformer-2 protein like protein alpha n=1 Tax=Fasciolopsis buskii TaxID=27845 RepID=A0A8E0RYI6_9TREM|nr:Transformer-2 protein like protein alpha [Fasciolopsis buski]